MSSNEKPNSLCNGLRLLRLIVIFLSLKKPFQVLDFSYAAEETDPDDCKDSMTQEDRKILIQEHNKHRRNTKPTASNMVFMVWSKELEIMAMDLTKQCSFVATVSTTESKKLNYWFSSIGVNYWRSEACLAFDWNEPIMSWVNSSKYYSYEKNSCRLGHSCDSYVQVVWGTASHLGCSIAHCHNSMSGSENSNFHNVVCFYGEGMDKYNEKFSYLKPWKEGTGCTNCPTGFSECNKDLCQTSPACETVVDCRDIPDVDTCLCDESVYKSFGQRAMYFCWTLYAGLFPLVEVLSSYL